MEDTCFGSGSSIEEISEQFCLMLFANYVYWQPKWYFATQTTRAKV